MGVLDAEYAGQGVDLLDTLLNTVDKVGSKYFEYKSLTDQIERNDSVLEKDYRSKTTQWGEIDPTMTKGVVEQLENIPTIYKVGGVLIGSFIFIKMVK